MQEDAVAIDKFTALTLYKPYIYMLGHCNNVTS
jgi:hypothetical protein